MRAALVWELLAEEVLPMCRVDSFSALVRESGQNGPPPRVVIGGEGRVLVCCLAVP